MEEIKHIFLTGEKRIGKSTILKKILQKKKFSWAGFQTLPYFQDQHFAGYRIQNAGFDLDFAFEDSRISVVDQNQNVKPVGITFDHLGVEIIQKAMETSDFILMDEIGRFEKHSYLFQKAVLKCLDSGKHVIGVLQDVDTEFHTALRNRKDVVVLKVTKENRDSMAEQIEKLMEQF